MKWYKKLLKNESGVSVLEVVISSFILSIILLSISTLILFAGQKATYSQLESSIMRANSFLETNIVKDLKEFPVIETKTIGNGNSENSGTGLVLVFEIKNELDEWINKQIVYENRGEGFYRVHENIATRIIPYKVKNIEIDGATLAITYLTDQKMEFTKKIVLPKSTTHHLNSNEF